MTAATVKHMSKAGFAQSKAGSFASFVTGQGGATSSSQPPKYHQRAPQRIMQNSSARGGKRPCSNANCTPESWETPEYFQDLEQNRKYCFVCWDAVKAKRFGLALSLEEMHDIGVTSFGTPPKLKPGGPAEAFKLTA
mmetsp:Transcript_11889/g.28806  ORF Transcript_11889/g.28806 Transcript_11889/m.28806 type:complete len:137 (-) Transcript_11889:294-704(-)|eukprot:CAMPEP_0178998464 /NCGR_PEP_ID=MMETSP0795-20121207/9525_1 /TAXON_ID=88552 /ORGANISM="Amoebophrya sp., Strain Ameob2" /LENGTH=136 /DNA_ID=CAMNT_0020691141 /DNA_START=385 /DNA_END=795 /DNA_ORIENTATION=+